MRYAFLFVFAIFSVLLWNQLSKDKDTSTIVQQVVPATVLVTNQLDSSTGGTGTGFIIGNNIIVTNNHVIEGNGKISVFSPTTSTKYPAKVIGKDKVSDIAILELEDWESFKKTEAPSIVSFSENETELGEKVIVVGHPWGLTWSVSEGIVSAKNRKPKASPQFLDQLDAKLYQGNSGGPVFNEEGEVVCISAMMLTGEGGSYGFCIPSILAQKVLTDLNEFKEVRWRTLSVSVEQLENSTVKISEVQPNKAADKAGLKSGDIIKTLYNNEYDEGLKVLSTLDLLTALAIMHGSEEKLSLEIERNGETLVVDVTTDFRLSSEFD